MFVNPDDFFDWHNRNPIFRGFNKKAFCDKHIFRRKLRQCGKFLFRLRKQFFGFSEMPEFPAGRRKIRPEDKREEKEETGG